MSTDESFRCNYMFVDGLEPSHGFSIRSHISREVCRQKKIEKAQVYRNVPVSGPLNWPQKPTILRFGPLTNRPGVRRPNHSRRYTSSLDNHGLPTDATQVSRDGPVQGHRHLGREVGQTCQVSVGPGKDDLLLLPNYRQLPQTLCEDDVAVDEAMDSSYGSDRRDLRYVFDQGGAPCEGGLPSRSSHGATCEPRANITPTLITSLSSRDSPCRLGAGFLDPFQDYPVKMDPLTKQLLYRRESKPLCWSCLSLRGFAYRGPLLLG